ncbi:MAG: hypothetical protein K5790_09080 [Nitrosopumilus sp.]|uniref:hypothetical protein n=1 Tax=Nitrosopumilus sp. TaxID=2024843 RepID=UPI00247D3F3E|nr:hypothetical protein [Nitrosopumilus sp.]MCV0393422.1 hypothetical protein [Nitrosopumilus sp.]
MKKILYFVLPIIAFLIIFVNAFFGHLIFSSESQQVVNKYSVYVHLLSDWKSDSKNIIFDVTNSWYKSDKDNKENYVFEAASKEYNSNQFQEINGKSYVELKHEFSDCQEDWQPMLYRKAVDTVRHEIEYVQGKQLSADPEISIYPDIDNKSYDNTEQQLKIKNGFVQFFPICTSKEITSYDYSVKIDNKDLGFDAYFVSSSREYQNFVSEEFDFYTELGCFAQNKQSYSGTCKNINKDSGLLVILPDEIKPWTTKITVNLYEIN